MPLLAEAEAARDKRDAGALEELAVRLAGAVARAVVATRRPAVSSAKPA